MKNLDLIAEELFNKIRGRFPSVTLGDAEGKVTNVPTDARFFDFDYKEGVINLGKVSVSLTETSVEIMYSDSFVSEQDDATKENWYNFLKEMRQFSKKRLMTFDTRNINKSNLDKRDYKFLAKNRGEETMSESKMYGTNRVSYQKVDGARIVVKHTESVNTELAGGRTRSIGKIYIESADGERFMYPFKHLSGARAMARHVAEGGKPFDEFGTHIVGLSEEMNKLRKFKSYMGRSAVMAESLAGYTDVVNDRIKTVKKTIESLQKPNYYAEAIGSFEVAVMEDVPADVKENWIDQLTIKQFNEELSDVFPYIYKLVSEATKAKELGPDDLVDESGLQYYTGKKKYGKEGMSALAQAGREGASEEELGAIKDKYKKTKEEIELESVFEEMMGQFAEASQLCKECGNPNWLTLGMSEEEIEEGERHGNSKIYDKCWKGYRKVAGKSAGEEGSCKKVESDQDAEEGNAYAQAVRQAKMDGKKKGDKVKGPDGDEITLEKQQLPITEFVLSMYDRATGQFPKGETAVLTAIEKDYGEQYINPAKAFIEAINAKFEELNAAQTPVVDEYEIEDAGTMMEPTIEQDEELDSIRRLSGI